ncbi:MAG: hypothetical protein Q9159_004880 [Coniocarpon cinnabarinum]
MIEKVEKAGKELERSENPSDAAQAQVPKRTSSTGLESMPHSFSVEQQQKQSKSLVDFQTYHAEHSLAPTIHYPLPTLKPPARPGFEQCNLQFAHALSALAKKAL